MPVDRIDKTVAGVRVPLPARLQHVAQQEHAGKLKAVLEVLVRPAIGTAAGCILYLCIERPLLRWLGKPITASAA